MSTNRQRDPRDTGTLASDRIAWQFLRRAGHWALGRQCTLTVEGLDNIPRTGPVLVAARHYHHLYDGCALIGSIPRRAHIVVGLDWAGGLVTRRAMPALCGMARWPVVMRAGKSVAGHEASSQLDREGLRALRASAGDVLDLWRDGRVVIVFPEGYPNIDPGWSPKTGDEFLPFQPGFLRYAALARRSGMTGLVIVPIGFTYQQNDSDHGKDRWTITMRAGPPIDAQAATVETVETEVRRLSA